MGGVENASTVYFYALEKRPQLKSRKDLTVSVTYSSPTTNSPRLNTLYLPHTVYVLLVLAIDPFVMLLDDLEAIQTLISREGISRVLA